MGSLSEWIQQGWYKGSPWLVPLRPLSMLVSLEAKRRLQRFRKEKPAPPVPVLVKAPTSPCMSAWMISSSQ